jgi:flagellar biogenesis protein FliO
MHNPLKVERGWLLGVAAFCAALATTAWGADKEAIGPAESSALKTKSEIVATPPKDGELSSTDADLTAPKVAVKGMAPVARKPKPLLRRSMDAAESDQAPRSQPSTGSWVLKTMGALGLVIALILLLRLILQRMNRYTPSGTDGLVELLGRSAIGPKTSIMFLRIDRRIVVVAQTPAGMNTLTEINDEEQIAALMARFEAAKPQSLSVGFKSLLSRFDRDHDVPTGTEVEASSIDEGGDSNERHLDRTRDSLGDLMARIRSYDPEGKA